LENIASRITDRTVQHYYREAFRDKTRKAFATSSPQKQPWQPRTPYAGKYGAPPAPVAISPLKRPNMGRREFYQMAFLACVINNPEICSDVDEDLGKLNFSSNNLDRVRQAVLSKLASNPNLDATSLKTYLIEAGFEGELGNLLSDRVYVHAAFARPLGDSGVVLQMWKDAWKIMELQDVKADIDQAVRAMKENPNEENENRLEAIRESRKSGDV
jgi:DNA primase